MILSQDLILLYYLLCIPMQLAAPTTIFHKAKGAIAVKEKYTGGSNNMKNILTPHNFPQIKLFPTLKIIGSYWYLFLSIVEILLLS